MRSRRFQRPRAVPAAARAEYGTTTNDRGRVQACVFVRCMAPGGAKVGPIWGTGDPSVLRALATLTVKCPCGAEFHQQPAGDE